jgi:hypothetical protein
VAISAGQSGAYLYPIKVSPPESLHFSHSSRTDKVDRESSTSFPIASYGTITTSFPHVYLLTQNRKPLLSKLVPTLGLSVGVLAFMFVFTYIPQGKIYSGGNPLCNIALSTRLRSVDSLLRERTVGRVLNHRSHLQ